MNDDTQGVPLVPGLLLGVGLGGFVDGIVLHQILQWHHMLTATDRYPSSTITGLEANTLADGLFYAATWVLVFIGTWLVITRATRWPVVTASACRVELDRQVAVASWSMRREPRWQIAK
jgi:uncharacterized membrane protein